MQEATPLFVDLDGCLIRTDVLWESCFAVLKTNPLYVFLLPIWLLRGKAHLKREVARRAGISPDLLPYSSELLEFLRNEKRSGRQLVLATSADAIVAGKIADYLQLFDAQLASDGTLNLSGRRKLNAIREHCGNSEFDYAGNARIDLDIWPHARAAILVNTSTATERTARRTAAVERVFQNVRPSVQDYLGALRAHQWLKNVLLFVPLLAAHAWRDLGAIESVLVAFIAFSLCASGNYIINDLFDVAADRTHPTKRQRPFAAGTIPIVVGLAVSATAIALGLLAAVWVGWRFTGTLLLYMAVSLGYSMHLKRLVLIDTITLAGLYTLRVLAGGAATGIPISFWLLALSMFLFLSLALVKRWSELTTLAQSGTLATTGRDYRVSDLPGLGSMGIASGYLSVAVFALYIQSPDVALRYAHPQALWLLCPVMLYWISRMWLKAGRGEMHEDPLVYAVRDRASRWLAVAGVIVVFVAL
jgi:4-hydroxybenzoate polyprenyltransferase